MLVPAFSPFPTVFSTVSRTEIMILTSILSSANAFNMDQAEILSFGKELIKIRKEHCVQMPLLDCECLILVKNSVEKGHNCVNNTALVTCPWYMST